MSQHPQESPTTEEETNLDKQSLESHMSSQPSAAAAPDTSLSQQLQLDGCATSTSASSPPTTSTTTTTTTSTTTTSIASTTSEDQIASNLLIAHAQNDNDNAAENEVLSPASVTPASSAPGSAERPSTRKRGRAKNTTESKNELGIDRLADELREKIASGGFAPNHPLAALRGSRLLFVDNTKCPLYNQKMDSQSVCCLSNRVDRFDEHNLPSFAHFLTGYRRHPAIFDNAISYMIDSDQTYAWQWLLGYSRLMAVPNNALEANFSPLCLERGIMNMSGFVTEKVRSNIYHL